MRWGRQQRERTENTAERLKAAEAASESVAATSEKVDKQLSLVERLAKGWAEVHERNHLAELFDQEWGRVR